MTAGRSTLLAAAALPLSLAVTIGIDLGTTNSAVAVLKNGAPVLVPNRRGEDGGLSWRTRPAACL